MPAVGEQRPAAAVLPRLILIAIAAGALWWAWRTRRTLLGLAVRALYKPPPPPPPPLPILAAEAEELQALAARTTSEPLTEALGLRDRIREIGALDDTTLIARIDGVVRQLGHQVGTRARVAASLAEFDEGRMELEMMDARQRLRSAADEVAREAAQRTLDGLSEQQALLDRLHVRVRELDTASRDTALELRGVHMALLDSASSRAGLQGSKMQEIRAFLSRGADDLGLRTAAEEEVERLLRDRRPGEP